jgi:DNA-binding beta-propeller fold protein YncE
MRGHASKLTGSAPYPNRFDPIFMVSWLRILVLVAGLIYAGLVPCRASSRWTHFEGRQTHPITISPDGSRLVAVNTPGGTLSVFDLSDPTGGLPILVREIRVGLEPVSVRARSSDEVWVVNEASDSVSIVSLTRETVVATLACPDEPADVVFAGGLAFVTCARNGLLRVFDPELQVEVSTLPLPGLFPRAMTASPDGSRIFVAFQLSGNGTTVLPPNLAKPQPAPTNPRLPPPPRTAEIVNADDPRVTFTVLDIDVVEISTTSRSVLRQFSGVGTCLFDLAWRPGTEELWIAGTDARNRIPFEPALRGRVAENRVTRIDLPSTQTSPFDLNPGIDYSPLTNTAAQAVALAQPMAIVFSPDGARGWLSAFGSDRVAEFDPSDGRVLRVVDVRVAHDGSTPVEPGSMRGPRGLAWHEPSQRLFVLNKFGHTISVVPTQPGSDAILAEVPLGSALPLTPAMRRGQALLHDARLSGNGTASCATCHVDADRDGLAWDLGDPAGEMLTVIGANLAAHDTRPQPREMHPMKGPMVTQTLRGLIPGQPLHWRGDRPTLAHFNITFRDLLGGSLLQPEQIEDLQAYLDSLRHHPNPHRTLSDQLAPGFQGANPIRGRDLFRVHINHCGVCHLLPTGSDQNVDDLRNFGGHQPIKTPELQTLYQRAVFDSRPGATGPAGFGLGHDGTGRLSSLPTVHFYELDELRGPDFADLTAFLLSFPSGTAPAVGFHLTVAGTNVLSPQAEAALSTVELQAAQTNQCDLVAHGYLRGAPVAYWFDPSAGLYQGQSSHTPPVSRSELLSALSSGDVMSFLGVPPGTGLGHGVDRNLNGVPDDDEPAPLLQIAVESGGGSFRWNLPSFGWRVERASTPQGPWIPALAPATPGPNPSEFYRLRRTW